MIPFQSGQVLADAPVGDDRYALATARARIIAETHADASVVNSVVETELARLTIPAGLVAIGDRINFTAFGDMLNNSAGTITYAPKVKLGATTLLAGTAVGVVISSQRRKWQLEVDFIVSGAAAQRSNGLMAVGPATSASLPGATTGLGIGWVGYGVATEDLAAAKDVVLTMTLGIADPLCDFILRAADLTLLKV